MKYGLNEPRSKDRTHALVYLGSRIGSASALLRAYTVYRELLRAAGLEVFILLAALHRPHTSSGYGTAGGEDTLLAVSLVQASLLGHRHEASSGVPSWFRY